jgi:hypothetical protein
MCFLIQFLPVTLAEGTQAVVNVKNSQFVRGDGFIVILQKKSVPEALD